MKKKISKAIMIGILLTFAILNIIYVIKVKGNIECFGASMLLNHVMNKTDYLINLIVFLIFIVGLSISYLILISKDSKKKDIKYDEEEENNKIKKVFIFISIVAILSGIILPNNSSDVYYYIASGRADSIYGYNMYDVNFVEIQNNLKDDKVVANSPTWDQKFVYGVVFAGICKLVGSIPTENITVLLYVFKILNIIAHLINCYLIYKITKSSKMVLIYGLNPLVIFEGLINCHNDIYMITFMLLAIYLKKKEKVGLAVLSIALGALVKYIPVIILPYIIWDKDNFKKMVMYGIEFLLIFFGINLLFLGDVSKILAALVQTNRYANSLYLTLIVSNVPVNVGKIALLGKILFCIIFFIQVVLKIKKETNVKTYVYLLLYFFLLIITNFRCWYLMILFGLLPDMKEKEINLTIAVTLIAEFVNFVVYYLGEGYIYGRIYFIFMMVDIFIYIILNKLIEKRKELVKTN